jgi:hypothetical protein
MEPNKVQPKEIESAKTNESNKFQLNENTLLYSLSIERDKLINYLQKNSEYNKLQKEISEFAKPIYNKWKLTLLGNCPTAEDYRCHKIYEIPTFELVDTIIKIAEHFQVKRIFEITLTDGLLSACIMTQTNKYITACIRIRTNNELEVTPFYNPATVNLYPLEIFNRFQRMDDICKMVIFNWAITSTDNNVIRKIAEQQKTEVIIVIGEPFGRSCLTHYTHEQILKNNYDYYILPVKQTCILDDCQKNSSYSQVSVYILHSKNNGVDLRKLCETNLFPENNDNKLTVNSALQDLARHKKIPLWFVNIKNEEQSLRCKEILYDVTEDKSTFPDGIIPQWIHNFEKLEFWHKNVNLKRFPLNIQSSKSFDTYYKMYTELPLLGLNKYKDEKWIPMWINSVDDGQKYFWLDYSTQENDKQWKESRRSFLDKYYQVSGSR